MVKKYTLYEAFKLGLIHDKQGQPYKHKNSLTLRIKSLYIKKSGIIKGMPVYQFSLSDIKKINSSWK